MPNIGRAGEGEGEGEGSARAFSCVPCSNATKNGVQAHANSSSMARRSRHSWADRHMEGGKDGVFPAVHDDKQDAGGLQRFGPVQSGPAGGWSLVVSDGPLKTR